MAVSAAMKARVKKRLLAERKTGGTKAPKVGGKKPTPKATPKKPGPTAAQKQKARDEAALAGLIDSAATLKYGEAEQSLATETGRTQAHGGTIDAAFNAYRDRVTQMLADQVGAMAQAGQAQAGVAAGVAGGMAAQGNQMAQQTAGQAAQYGLDGGAQAQQAASLAGQLANVSGLRAQAKAGSTAGIGLAQHGLLQQQALAGEAQRGLAHKQNMGRIGELGAKSTQLAKEKGAFKTTYKADLESKAAEQQLAAQALGVKAQESQRDYTLKMLGLKGELADTKADNARENAKLDAKVTSDAAKLDLEERKLLADITSKAKARAQKDRALDIAEFNAKTKAAGTKGSKASSAQNAKWRQQKAKIAELSAAYGSLRSRGYDDAEARKKLKGVSRVEINMAVALSQTGVLGATNQQAARGYFVNGYIPKSFLDAKRGPH